MGDAIKGRGPEQNITIPPPLRPPTYGAANWMGNQIPSLWGQPLPTYGRPLDQGMSPTAKQGIHFLQDRATSGAPDILGQAQGALGGLMNPGQSGLRNPFSMASSTGGGPATMTPEALQSSRDAMMRFQNPSYNMAVPRMGQGYGAPFGGAKPPQSGGGPPPPGGFPPSPPSSDFTIREQPFGNGGQGMLQAQLQSGRGGQSQGTMAGGDPKANNPNFMLNANYQPRAPGDNSRDLRSTDERYVPVNPGNGQSRVPGGAGRPDYMASSAGQGNPFMQQLLQLFSGGGRGVAGQQGPPSGGAAWNMGGGASNVQNPGANPFGVGAAADAARTARYGAAANGVQNRPANVAHGGGRFANIDALNSAMSAGTLPGGVRDMLAARGITGNQITPLGYSDLSHGGGLGGIEQLMQQQFDQSAQGQAEQAYLRGNPAGQGVGWAGAMQSLGAPPQQYNNNQQFRIS